LTYEPPNGGNQTFGVMNNTPSFPVASDPASITDTTNPTILQNSFLWTGGYSAETGTFIEDVR